MIPLELLPTVNAVLNGTSALLLLRGWRSIRRGDRLRHKRSMIAAALVSTLFLASYLYYHFHVGTTRFAGTGAARPIYFTILLTHTVLAAAVPILAGLSFWRAFQERFDRHRQVARWTLPIWLYVSVTGVVIYLMLYHFYPSHGAGGAR
jgi:uncharacterized membrane protein YozB (DUF420 family)